MDPRAFHRSLREVAAVLIAGTLLGPTALRAQSLEITYLANEGFLLAAGEIKVSSAFITVASGPRCRTSVC